MYYNNKEKVNIPVTIQTLELSLYYLLSIPLIHKKFIKNIKDLLNMMDKTPYQNDDYQIFVIRAIEFTADLRGRGASNFKYIKSQLEQSGLDKNYVAKIYDDMSQNELSKEEYDNIVRVISDYVDYAYLYIARPLVMQCYDELISSNGNILSNAIAKLKKELESVVSHMRVADTSTNENNEIDFDGKGSKIPITDINRTYDNAHNPSKIFVTGLRELNRILNGGFQRGRTYIWYAPTNSFKSAILLYNALWIMEFNKDAKPKFPNKKLGILLLNMENSADETLERMFSIYSNGSDVKEVDKETWVNEFPIMQERWNDFRFYIRYVSPGITPIEIESYVKELEEEKNVEICTVILDHLGNVGYVTKRAETYNAIKDTTYALSHWAKENDILLITAMHTNSEFDAKLAEAQEAGQTNLVRKMGRHCIADAKAIDRVVDESIYILKEWNPYDSQWYIGFKRGKVRGSRRSGSDIFYHMLKNEIVLEYDNDPKKSCLSYPCVPGSSETIQMQQTKYHQNAQMQNLNYGNKPYNSMPVSPLPNGNANPFIRHQQIQPRKMYEAVHVQFNQPTDLSLESDNKNTNIMNDFVNQPEDEEDGITDSDFENANDDELFLNFDDGNETANEDFENNGPNDEDFKDSDSELQYISEDIDNETT